MSVVKVSYSAMDHLSTVTVPADKSLTHRGILLGAMAAGKSKVNNWLSSDDCIATVNAVRSLGVTVDMVAGDCLLIESDGLQGLNRAPNIDLGNSGTALRLLAGVLVGKNIAATLTGDASLSSRPMNRIIDPLRMMNAQIKQSESAVLAIDQTPQLQPLTDYVIPVVSAQVKSCLLLAGLGCSEASSIIEPRATRKHTENMLAHLSADIQISENFDASGATKLSISKSKLDTFDCTVPSDPSSAAFFAGFALLGNRSITLKNVLLSEQRIGFYRCLQQMNANVELQPTGHFFSEPVGDIHIAESQLKGCAFSHPLVSDGIDEMPMLSILACIAEGRSVFSGLEELRVKETDRLNAMTTNLQSQGMPIEETSDGWIIDGNSNHTFPGGAINSFNDHRIAMSFAMASVRSKHAFHISDWHMVASSFPNFAQLVSDLGIEIQG